jgi:zinc/manganese transport system permease protein
MGTILAYLGIHVLKREVIFIDIAVAQVAAVGSIAAHLAFDAEQDSLLAYATSLLCVLLISAFYAAARTAVVQISIETVIGISYAITAAAAMFLIGMHPGHVHAGEMLAGSLLWVTWRHIIASAVVFSAVGIMLYLFRKPISEVSQDYDRAVAGGLKAMRWDFLFYALLGAVITLAVRISGVVSVFAFLIIPATTSALFARSWAARLLIAWATAAVSSVAGLLFAYYLDFSVGPAVALFLGGALVVAAVLKLTILKPVAKPAEVR